jgi:2-amino-4-hydroxy-6-hydroxymethyldihydropteridine diphosphokinase
VAKSKAKLTIRKIGRRSVCNYSSPVTRHRVFIGIGSNQGDRLGNCRRAVQAVAAAEENCFLECSPWYATEPVGLTDQDWFINGVIALETSLGPRELLLFLLGIEKMMGRERKERWGPRVIDLDILFYDQQVLDEEGLQIPHPRIPERGFVLIPLWDIAPHLFHPLLKKTITGILAEFQGEEKVIPFREDCYPACTA